MASLALSLPPSLPPFLLTIKRPTHRARLKVDGAATDVNHVARRGFRALPAQLQGAEGLVLILRRRLAPVVLLGGVREGGKEGGRESGKGG